MGVRFFAKWSRNTRERVVLLAAFIPMSLLMIYCGALYFQCRWAIEQYLKSQNWVLPSTVYAHAPVLEKGMALKRETLLRYFQRLSYHRAESASAAMKPGDYSVSSTSIVFQKRQLFAKQPGHHPIRIDLNSDRIQRLTDLQTSQPIEQYELEPVPIRNLFGNQTEKRRIVSYEDLPSHLIQAVIAIEDRRFFQHHGVDFTAILRAITNNLGDNKVTQGASTITQQFVKNSFLTPEKSIHRKLSEAMMAMMLERRLTKKRIFELYLNEIYLGQSGAIGIHGVGEASHFFFSKDVNHLTVGESALLAGIIQAPSTLNPYRHADDAKRRRNVVLAAMANLDFITPEQCNRWWNTPVRVHPAETNSNFAPYFSDLVGARLAKKYNVESISGNLSIFTTLDIEMQQAAEDALARGLVRIDSQRFASTHKRVQGCLIAIEPDTGYIRAFVGGRDAKPGQFNRVNQASRQPGSVFKPMVYAAALEKTFPTTQNVQRIASATENHFTPATTIEDEPFVLKYSNQIWEPKNYDGQYHGTVTLRTALAQSFNVATARLASQVGWRQIASLAQKAGFTNLKPYPSVALGAFETTPWQVASAYTVFANGGIKTELRPITNVTDYQGKTLQTSQHTSTRILHPETAFLITDMLRSVMVQGTAASVREKGFTRTAAGKTGTTDDFRDAWFAGYIPQLLCVVWVGYDDNTPIGMNGAQAALPIWIDFMKTATEDLPVREFQVPAGIVAERIDPSTGFRATPACPYMTDEVFIRGTAPQAFCQEHQGQFFTYMPSDPIRREFGERYRRPTHARPRDSGFWKKFRRIFRLS